MKVKNGLAYFTFQDVDLVLHIGDQVYPDDEDISHAGKFFHQIFDELVKRLNKQIRFVLGSNIVIRFTPVLYFILSRPGGGNFRPAGYILAAKAIFLASIQHI